MIPLIILVLLAFALYIWICRPFFVVRFLWWIYGYTYDGLLDFYPYRNLITLVGDRFAATEGRVLEIGCGTGNVLTSALVHSQDVVGIDLSSSMIGIAHRKHQSSIKSGQLVLGITSILPFLQKQPDCSFDTIVSVNVLYALENRELIWKELFRVLRPGGKMIMTTAVATGSKHLIREHIDNDHRINLFRPKLVGVFLIDSLIDLLAGTGHFAFPSSSILKREVEKNGGRWVDERRCYGGEHSGVNVLFTVLKP